MKNMKVAVAQILSFSIVIVLAIAIGVVGIVGITMLNNASQTMYESATPMYEIAHAAEDFQRARVYVTEAVVLTGNASELDRIGSELTETIANFEQSMSNFEATIHMNEAAERALFNSVMSDYHNIAVPAAMDVIAEARQGLDSLVIKEGANFGRFDSSSYDIAERILDLAELRNVFIDATDDANQVLADTLLVVIIAVIVVVVVISIILALYISGLITKPIKMVVAFLSHASTTGDMALSDVQVKDIEVRSKLRSEMGDLYANLAAFVMRIIAMSEEVNRMADGDFSKSIDELSPQDTLGTSLNRMTDSLNEMFSEINSASAQVSAGSQQIASGSQTLAQGSTEQAATVQQLSASASDIAEQTKANAELAGKAANLANTIRGNAEKGSRQMDEMMTAVDEINQSSQSISKVIKVIDDIAFQTNILALNAAVEAARAGQHGKGFAVVADEVRTLAAKSAEAAKETGALILNSTEKAEQGTRIAKDTSESLAEIVEGIGESSAIINDIATSSNAQTIGIEQINNGTDQVANVVQQNSATAEESAAAAQELSGQSVMLEEMISKFKLKSSSSYTPQLRAAQPAAPAYEPPPANPGLPPDMGKY